MQPLHIRNQLISFCCFVVMSTLVASRINQGGSIIVPSSWMPISLDADAIANAAMQNTTYNGLNNYFKIDLMRSMCEEFGIVLSPKQEEDCIHFRLEDAVLKEDEMKELLDTYIYHKKQEQYAELKRQTREKVQKAIMVPNEGGGASSILLQAYQTNYEDREVKKMLDAKREEIMKTHVKAFALIRSDEDALKMVEQLKTCNRERLTALCKHNYFLPPAGSHIYMSKNEIDMRIRAVQDAFKSYSTAVAYVSNLLSDLQNAIYSYVLAYVKFKSYCTEYHIRNLMRTQERIAFEKQARNEKQLKYKNKCQFLLEHMCNIISAVPSMRAHVNSLMGEWLIREECTQFSSEVWMQYAVLNDPNRVQSVFEYLTGYRSGHTLQTIKHSINKTVLNIKHIQFRKKVVELVDKQIELDIPDMVGHIFQTPDTVYTEECAKHIATAFLKNEMDLKESLVLNFIQTVVKSDADKVNVSVAPGK